MPEVIVHSLAAGDLVSPSLSAPEQKSLRVNVKAIGAVQLEPAQAGRLGSFCQLPAGSVLTTIGDGFNEQTVLVRCGEVFYIVFRQDLGLAAEESAPPARIS